MHASKVLQLCEYIDESTAEIHRPTAGQLENAIKPLADLLIDVTIDDEGVDATYKVAMRNEIEKRIRSNAVLSRGLEKITSDRVVFKAAEPVIDSEDD